MRTLFEVGIYLWILAGMIEHREWLGVAVIALWPLLTLAGMFAYLTLRNPNRGKERG